MLHIHTYVICRYLLQRVTFCNFSSPNVRSRCCSIIFRQSFFVNRFSSIILWFCSISHNYGYIYCFMLIFFFLSSSSIYNNISLFLLVVYLISLLSTLLTSSVTYELLHLCGNSSKHNSTAESVVECR